MLLDSLKIQNFRALEDLEIAQLGRVNLIVGKNNVGKSSVLEAIEIYASLGSPLVLEKLLERHNERLNLTHKEFGNYLPVEHFFLNRIFNEQGFYIGNKEASNDIKITCHNFSKFTMMNNKEGKKNSFDFNLYDQASYYHYIRLINDFRINYCAIPSDLSASQELSDIWDNNISLNHDYKAMILEGLKIIEKGILDLGFREQALQRVPFVAIRGNDRPVSLSSMGDGVQRILQLLVSMVKVKDGFLLIDEFENGLHYSVQEKVWRLIFEWAEKLNIQVFVTTHSWDCIKSFQNASQEFDDSAMLFNLSQSVLTSDKGKVIVDEYDSERLKGLVESEWELR